MDNDLDLDLLEVYSMNCKRILLKIPWYQVIGKAVLFLCMGIIIDMKGKNGALGLLVAFDLIRISLGLK